MTYTWVCDCGFYLEKPKCDRCGKISYALMNEIGWRKAKTRQKDYAALADGTDPYQPDTPYTGVIVDKLLFGYPKTNELKVGKKRWDQGQGLFKKTHTGYDFLDDPYIVTDGYCTNCKTVRRLVPAPRGQRGRSCRRCGHHLPEPSE